ncbi:MAG: helicase-related protein, partial [Endomicrobiia bacterium]
MIDGTEYRLKTDRPKIHSVVYQRTEKLTKEIVDRGEKVVIFTEFVQVAEDLSKLLAPYGCAVITGQTSSRSRVIADFEKSDSPTRVLIVTRPSVAEAVNLVAANNAIFVNSPWTYQQLSQALNRIYRIGQKKEVNIYFIDIEGTVTETQKKNIEKTREIFESVFKNPTISPEVSNLLSSVYQRVQNLIKGSPVDTIAMYISSLVEGFEIAIKITGVGKINAKFTTSDGSGVEVRSYDEFVKHFLGRLSKESQDYLREFVRVRTKSEIESGVPIKETFLWNLAGVFMPEIAFTDYDGNYEPIMSKALVVVRGILEGKTVKDIIADLGANGKQDLIDVLEFLSRNNILDGLVGLGIFKLDEINSIRKELGLLKPSDISVVKSDKILGKKVEIPSRWPSDIEGYERTKLKIPVTSRNALLYLDTRKFIEQITSTKFDIGAFFIESAGKVKRLLKSKLWFYKDLTTDEISDIELGKESVTLAGIIKSLPKIKTPRGLDKKFKELNNLLYSIKRTVDNVASVKSDVIPNSAEILETIKIIEDSIGVVEIPELVSKLKLLDSLLPIQLRANIPVVTASLTALGSLSATFLGKERGQPIRYKGLVCYWDSINKRSDGNIEAEILLIESGSSETRNLTQNELSEIMNDPNFRKILDAYGIRELSVKGKVIGEDKLRYNNQLLTRTILSGISLWGYNFADPEIVDSISFRNAWNFALNLVEKAADLYNEDLRSGKKDNESLARKKLVLAARVLNRYCIEDPRKHLPTNIVSYENLETGFDLILKTLIEVAESYVPEQRPEVRKDRSDGLGGIFIGDTNLILRNLGVSDPHNVSEVYEKVESRVISHRQDELEIPFGGFERQKVRVNQVTEVGTNSVGQPIRVTIKPVSSKSFILDERNALPALVIRTGNNEFNIYIPEFFLDSREMDLQITLRILSRVISNQIIPAAEADKVTLKDVIDRDSLLLDKQEVLTFGKEKRKLPSFRVEIQQAIYSWVNNIKYLSLEEQNEFNRIIQSFAQMCGSYKDAKILLAGGMDTTLAAEIIAGDGNEVRMFNVPMSLAEMQYQMRKEKYTFGVYITEDGKILFLNSSGEKIDINTEQVIEALLKSGVTPKYMQIDTAIDIGRAIVLPVSAEDNFVRVLKSRFIDREDIGIITDAETLQQLSLVSGDRSLGGLLSSYIKQGNLSIAVRRANESNPERKTIGFRVTESGSEYYDVDGSLISEQDLVLALVYYIYEYLGYKGNIGKNFATTNLVDEMVRIYGCKIEVEDSGSDRIHGDFHQRVWTTDPNRPILSMTDTSIDNLTVSLLLRDIVGRKGKVATLVTEARQKLSEKLGERQVFHHEIVGKKVSVDTNKFFDGEILEELITYTEKISGKKVVRENIFKWLNGVKIPLEDGSFVILRVDNGRIKVYVETFRKFHGEQMAKKLSSWVNNKVKNLSRDFSIGIGTLIAICLTMVLGVTIFLSFTQPLWMLGIISNFVGFQITTALLVKAIPFFVSIDVIQFAVALLPVLVVLIGINLFYSSIVKGAAKEGLPKIGLSQHLETIIPAKNDSTDKAISGKFKPVEIKGSIIYIKRYVFERIPLWQQPLAFVHQWLNAKYESSKFYEEMATGEGAKLAFRMFLRTVFGVIIKIPLIPLVSIMMLYWYFKGEKPWETSIGFNDNLKTFNDLQKVVRESGEKYDLGRVTVSRVNDGDGFVVLQGENKEIKYRLRG